MEKAEFEKRFLALCNETDVLLTVANVAYRLEVAVTETQEHLGHLERAGIIRKSTTDDGTPCYELPGRSAGQVQSSAPTTSPANPAVHNPADLPAAAVYRNDSSGAARGRSVNGLVLNTIIPGVGSLVCGKMTGLLMLLLLAVGIAMFFVLSGWHKAWGVAPIVVAWIWSIIAGIGLLDDKEPSAGQPA